MTKQVIMISIGILLKDSNTVASYQTDDNSNGGQYSFNDIDAVLIL